jgi:spore coat polysaccharide biosynthesis protein SpsF
MTSSRLPGKVLLPLADRSVLSWVISAARESGVISKVVVATSTDSSDDPIVKACEQDDAPVVRGPLEDVLSRFVLVLDEYAPRAVVRLTADCPLLDPALIRMVVGAFDETTLDYLSTTLNRSLPRGLDVEIVSEPALRKANAEASGPDRAHVTSFIYRNPDQFRLAGISFVPSYEEYRVTLDTEADYRALVALVAEIGDSPPSWIETVEILRSRPDIVALNEDVPQKSLEEG